MLVPPGKGDIVQIDPHAWIAQERENIRVRVTQSGAKNMEKGGAEKETWRSEDKDTLFKEQFFSKPDRKSGDEMESWVSTAIYPHA